MNCAENLRANNLLQFIKIFLLLILKLCLILLHVHFLKRQTKLEAEPFTFLSKWSPVPF